MKCDNEECNNEVPEDNLDRVCAYQIDWENPQPDYRCVPRCYCCDTCRELCHQGLFEQNQKK